MMCQCMLISCKKCTFLVKDAESGYACVRAEGMWEISLPSAQFCCDPKTALKNKVCLKMPGS